jgi:hypothetical protein
LHSILCFNIRVLELKEKEMKLIQDWTKATFLSKYNVWYSYIHVSTICVTQCEVLTWSCTSVFSSLCWLP